VLVVLCHGLLRDDGTSALDVDKAPWSTMKKSAVNPNAEEFKGFMKRAIVRKRAMAREARARTLVKVSRVASGE
jgi:hypothetical protein